MTDIPFGQRRTNIANARLAQDTSEIKKFCKLRALSLQALAKSLLYRTYRLNG
jgi:hypothetical protein